MTDTAPQITLPIDSARIQEMLPHRYPFLLVDRVVEVEPGKRIRALKNVTRNEPFFDGHFPNKPVMPGVLIIEAMAQAGGLLTQLSEQASACDNKQYFLVKVDEVRFSRMVVPGDQLVLEVELRRTLRRMGFYSARALVDGEEAARAEIVCADRSA
ncbi:3-hydroxyacyl-ACP dehydratase FabZ [Coralloluteibacterium stylophorae]|uniref:3-hydroxyacyl-[acyl-carrier-protein] dehydratase FabZ n=1 Tax=Coralloluteibacterium stylophorae TaxID=1776034 RepID=A0A8J8AY51_9GAMM|nr:3-hydroxyacyl-ACP dehydratase FabZ [Coralloluteibacterium stylophorae]MBS7456343.1 3-hydroxyacyl-ACP dehydratase FabZ [Coralloluteibacterium stylophorae]